MDFLAFMIDFPAIMRYTVLMKTYQTNDFNYLHSKTEDPSSMTILDHIHSGYEFLYFLDGNADYAINASVYPMKKRDFLLIHPGEYHHLIPNNSSPYERICIHFSPSIVPKAFQKDIETLKSVYHIHKYSAIDNIFSMLLDAEYNNGYSESDIVYLIQQHLGVILTHLKYLQDETDIAPIESNELINNVLNYIDENITKPINVETLSQTFFKSPSSLAHSFSSIMHFPLQHYITSKKIIYAQMRIRQGVSPTSVALQLSFKDYSTFFKAYKRVLGKSPMSDRPQA